MAWIGPAFIPDIATRVLEGSGVTDNGIRLIAVGPEDPPAPEPPRAGAAPASGARVGARAPAPDRGGARAG